MANGSNNAGMSKHVSTIHLSANPQTGSVNNNVVKDNIAHSVNATAVVSTAKGTSATKSDAVIAQPVVQANAYTLEESV